MPATEGTLPQPAHYQIRIESEARLSILDTSQVMDQVRQQLALALMKEPQRRHFVFSVPGGQAAVNHVSGEWSPGAPLHLDNNAPSPRRNGAGTGPTDPARRVLPDPLIAEQAARLHGEPRAVINAVILRQCCRDGDRMERWCELTGSTLSAALRGCLGAMSPVALFHGMPGVGKTVTAMACADGYCRAIGAPGSLYLLSTAVRGNGTVNDGGNRLRAAFAAVRERPSDEVKVVVLDEADAIGMRRTTEQAHHEDRAMTEALIQCMDEAARIPRLLIILCTNLLSYVDAAIQRRCTIYHFQPPDPAVRQEFLALRLPDLSPTDLKRAVRLSANMTPADMERALVQAVLDAVDASEPLTPGRVFEALRQAARTEGLER